MKTYAQLRAKISAMPREELELLAANVVVSLYGEALTSDGCEIGLNQNLAWTCDTIEAVAEDVHNANLNPDKL